MADPTGIDVSYAQGSFNWGAYRNKISFGMCKVTEGLTITDPDWVHNWNSIWSLNSTHTLPRFAYHFFHASDDPAKQAERFVSTVKTHGLLAGDNLVLDLEATESNGTNDHVAPATVAARGRQFLEHLDRLVSGTRVLVYTNPSFAEAGNCAGMNSWALWIAHYGVSKPTVPKPWSNWTFWQTGDSPIDEDRFNGTEAQLLSWTRMPKSR
jgi:GH25 family lysozyme M1 (1,4-beta-N-acetylmuramidase)